ncbi:MAG: MMPL family transporter [Demequinaceae bacterium]|nr:MMPL family transporter [Demequinaceae bacterium]
MFASIAGLIARRPRTVLIAWIVAALGMYLLATVGVGGGNLFQRAATGLPTVQGADSTQVYEFRVAHPSETTGPLLTAEFSGIAPDDASLDQQVTALATQLAARPGVIAVMWPKGVVPGPEAARGAGEGGAATPELLVSTDDRAFLLTVSYVPFADSAAATTEHQDVQSVIQAATSGWPAPEPVARVYSNPLLINDFTTQIEKDLLTGEAVALPIALLVMVFVFGGFLAASAPLIGAFASIAGGLAVLFGFSYPIDLDQAAINVVTVLAIGLSIDYGLLVVSRYREEIARLGDSREHDVRADALGITLATAGRTVAFSAVTVAISVGGMLVFKAELIRGIGGAALGAVVMALLSALTLVPTVLFLYGHRLAKRPLLDRVPGVRRVLRRTADVSSEDGFFSRLALSVQRRPWAFVGAVAGLLLVLASPILDIAVRNSDYQLLPTSNERRQMLDGFDERYPALASAQIDILAEATPAELDSWLADALAVDGVTRATESTAIDGMATAGLFTAFPDQAGEDAAALVNELRALPAPFPIYLGGQAAIQIDFVDSLTAGAPWALGLVVLATFVLLFLMTGSLLVPVKTLVINGLSLAATLGIVSWIFADGHLQGPLQFTTTGGVETYVLVMIIAFGFGLAMDYEVFLLARIKEHIDAGETNDEAVRKGLQRSGRIITSAAAVIVLVFVGFASGQLLVIKEVGIGLAVAVFLDATLVRMLLVPATMTLLGKWNWWAPAPLRRLYERRGLLH